MERYDVLCARESNGKSYFTKLGVMFPNKSGDGFTVFLDAVPAPNEGQFKLIVKRPQERSAARSEPAAGYPSYGKDDDDSVPF